MSVVVGYSPTPQGRTALRAALREADHHHLRLVVASHGHLDAVGGRVAAEHDAVMQEIAGLDLSELGLRDATLPEVEVRTCAEGEVGEFLLDVAEQEQARLLVIGLRGKSRIGKLNLGTSAQKVVLGSPCPVLAVKEPRPDTEERAHD